MEMRSIPKTLFTVISDTHYEKKPKLFPAPLLQSLPDLSNRAPLLDLPIIVAVAGLLPTPFYHFGRSPP